MTSIVNTQLDIRDKTIFITGGAGFIGSNLVERLVDDNHVVVYDNYFRNALEGNAVLEHPNLSVVEGSVLDGSRLAGAMAGADYVVHCAAIAGIGTVVCKPVNTMRVNMIGSANVLEAASKLENCERVVCFSTSEIFGQTAFNSTEKDCAVTGQLGEARWTYAVSKLAIEHLAIAYHSELNLPVTVLRPFNVYGPGQVGDGALKTFIQKAIRNEPIEIHGDGTQIRAWCYVDDMVDGVLHSMVHPQAVGESFNIGNKKTVTTIFGLANTVVRVLESSSEIKYTRKDYVDVEFRVPSVSKATEVLGYEAIYDLEEGIKLTAEYYKEHQKKSNHGEAKAKRLVLAGC